jgi:hypothetical protein
LKALRIIKEASVKAVEQGAPVEVSFGVVKTVNPLVITVEQRLDVPAEFLFLTNDVRDYTVSMKINGEIEEVTVYNGLKKGDKVLLLKIQKGQGFVVLSREVMA